jgi:hypothetical protein
MMWMESGGMMMSHVKCCGTALVIKRMGICGYHSPVQLRVYIRRTEAIEHISTTCCRKHLDQFHLFHTKYTQVGLIEKPCERGSPLTSSSSRTSDCLILVSQNESQECYYRTRTPKSNSSAKSYGFRKLFRHHPTRIRRGSPGDLQHDHVYRGAGAGCA